MDLEERVKKLEQWQADRMNQQITAPLDDKSKTILNQDFLSVIKTLVFTNPSGREFVYGLAVQNSNPYLFSANGSLISYVVNTSTDTITTGGNIVDGGQVITLPNDTRVIVNTTGTAPGGLINRDYHYVVSSTSTSFKLSNTLGGAAINITSVGTGEQFLEIA